MHKHSLRVLAFAAVLLVSGPSLMAQEDQPPLDARLVGYGEKHMLPEPGAAGAWLALIGLGIICLGPLFLHAKRTHLD